MISVSLRLPDEVSQRLERLAEELGIRPWRHPADGDLQASRREDPPAQGAVGGHANHLVEGG